LRPKSEIVKINHFEPFHIRTRSSDYASCENIRVHDLYVGRYPDGDVRLLQGED
jgi:hypothetical protein